MEKHKSITSNSNGDAMFSKKINYFDDNFLFCGWRHRKGVGDHVIDTSFFSRTNENNKFRTFVPVGLSSQFPWCI